MPHSAKKSECGVPAVNQNEFIVGDDECGILKDFGQLKGWDLSLNTHHIQGSPHKQVKGLLGYGKIPPNDFFVVILGVLFTIFPLRSFLFIGPC